MCFNKKNMKQRKWFVLPQMLVPNLTTNVEYELYTQVSLKLAWPFYEIQEIYLHFILSLDINSDVSSSSKSSYDTLLSQALTSSLYREDLVYPGKVSETHTLTVNRSIYDDDNVHDLVDGDDDENNCDGFIFFDLYPRTGTVTASWWVQWGRRNWRTMQWWLSSSIIQLSINWNEHVLGKA